MVYVRFCCWETLMTKLMRNMESFLIEHITCTKFKLLLTHDFTMELFLMEKLYLKNPESARLLCLKKPFYKRKNKYEEAIQHISVKGIKLTPKEWYPLSFSAKIWNSRKTSSFAADGLIFQPLNTQLTHGVQKDVFKWKPNHTVDFYLSSLHTKQGESDYSWLLEIGDGPRIINASPEFNITLEFRDLCSERKLLERCSSHGRIVVECFMEIDNDSSTWTAIPQCIRADKGTANDKFVVTRTLLNIKENITVEELVCKDF